MELAWQAQDSHHAQNQLDSEALRKSPRSKQLLVVGILSHGFRNTTETVEYTEYGEQTNGNEGK